MQKKVFSALTLIVIVGVTALYGFTFKSQGNPDGNCTYQGEYLGDTMDPAVYYECDANLNPVWHTCHGEEIFCKQLTGCMLAEHCF